MKAEKSTGFLIPESGVEMELTYTIVRTILKCTLDLKDEMTIDLKANYHVYDSVLVQGQFDLFNAPVITEELTIADDGVLTVDVHDGYGGCDSLGVLGEAILDGKLVLDFTGITPVEGKRYFFLDADSFSGQFDELEVLGIDPRMVDYDMAGGT